MQRHSSAAPGLIHFDAFKLTEPAQALKEKLIRGDGVSLDEVARREGMTGSWFTRVLRRSWLAPDITEAILAGRHPPELTALRLLKGSRLPLLGLSSGVCSVSLVLVLTRLSPIDATATMP